MFRFPLIRLQLVFFLILFLSICISTSYAGKLGSILILNELLFNPNGPDGGNEWIELTNPSNETRNISGWMISNKTGIAVVSLPNWDVPGYAYLIVHFGNGTNDSNFTDGSGHFYYNHTGEIFNNSKDECGLFNSIPGNSSIIDFISWSSDEQPSKGEAFKYAINAGRWTSGDYLNISWTKNSVSDGESIGRDRNSTDTDKAADWSSHGGKDAYFPTPGSANKGPLYSADDGILLTQTQANLILIHYGYDVLNSSHEVIEKRESENDVNVSAVHSFVCTYGNDSAQFNGTGTFHWRRSNSSSAFTRICLNLSSDNRENIRLDYSERVSTPQSLTYFIIENLSAIYSLENGNMSYQENSISKIRYLSFNNTITNSTNQIIDGGSTKIIKSFKRELAHSDLHGEVWEDISIITNNKINNSISKHYDIYSNPDNPEEYNASFDKYLVEEDSIAALVLDGEGYHKLEKLSNILYKYTWNYPFINMKENHSENSKDNGFIYYEIENSSGEQVISGNITSIINGTPVTLQFSIDGWKIYVGKKALEYGAEKAVDQVVDYGIDKAKESIKIKYRKEREINTALYNYEIISQEPGLTCVKVNFIDYARIPIEGNPIIRGPDPLLGLSEEEFQEPICYDNPSCDDLPKKRYKLLAKYLDPDGNVKYGNLYIDIAVKGTPCDDNNPCTNDFCSTDGKCIELPKCPEIETCYPSSQFVAEPTYEGGSILSSLSGYSVSDCLCEISVGCEAGKCIYEKYVKSCNDNDICTIDKCGKYGECQYTRNEDCKDENEDEKGYPMCRERKISLGQKESWSTDFGLYVEDNQCPDDTIVVEIDKGSDETITTMGGSQCVDIGHLKPGIHTLTIYGFSGGESLGCSEAPIVTYGVTLTIGGKAIEYSGEVEEGSYRTYTFNI